MTAEGTSSFLILTSSFERAGLPLTSAASRPATETQGPTAQLQKLVAGRESTPAGKLCKRGFALVIPLVVIEPRDRVRFITNARREFFRREDARVFPPAQDPALDLFQAA